MTATPIASKKRILIIVTRSPYSGSFAREGLDYCLASAAFDQDIKLLFTGDAVLQLLKNQNSSEIQQKNLSKTLAVLPVYGIETLYIDTQSLINYGLQLSDLNLNVEGVNATEIAALTESANIIMSF